MKDLFLLICFWLYFQAPTANLKTLCKVSSNNSYITWPEGDDFYHVLISDNQWFPLIFFPSKNAFYQSKHISWTGSTADPWTPPRGPTNMWTVFNSKYYSATQSTVGCIHGYRTTDAQAPHIQRGNEKAQRDSQPLTALAPQRPLWSRVQLQ